jgi:hypothetical protein
MKLRAVLIISILLIGSIIQAQNFPIGVFSTTSSSTIDANNIATIKSLGVNWLINTTWNPALLTDVNIIASNVRDENDLVSYYSSGQYNKLETEDSVGNSVVGIKHDIGCISGSYYYSGRVADTTKYLIRGPNYHQYTTYSFPTLSGQVIPYRLRIKMRMGTTALGTGDTVCKLTVYYKNGDKYATLLDTVMKRTDLSTTDAIYLFRYTYNNYLIQPNIIVNPVNGLPKISSTTIETPLTDGIQYRIKWYGNRELYVDYIELYDETIWRNYLDDPSQIRSDISRYANDNNFATLKYWYGCDEPTSRDSYIPYKIIDTLLNNLSTPKPLQTTFFPQWNNILNSEYQIPLFVSKCNPVQFMFDYYPVETKW